MARRFALTGRLSRRMRLFYFRSAARRPTARLRIGFQPFAFVSEAQQQMVSDAWEQMLTVHRQQVALMIEAESPVTPN